MTPTDPTSTTAEQRAALVKALYLLVNRAEDIVAAIDHAPGIGQHAVKAEVRDEVMRSHVRLFKAVGPARQALAALATAQQEAVVAHVNTGSGHDNAMAWSEGHTAGYEEAEEAARRQMVALPVGRYEASRYDTDDLHRLHLWADGRSWDIDVPRSASQPTAQQEAPAGLVGAQVNIAFVRGVLAAPGTLAAETELRLIARLDAAGAFLTALAARPSPSAAEADRWAKYVRLAMVAADWFRHDVDTYPGTGKPFFVYTRPDDNRLVRLRDALIECGEEVTHEEPQR